MKKFGSDSEEPKKNSVPFTRNESFLEMRARFEREKNEKGKKVPTGMPSLGKPIEFTQGKSLETNNREPAGNVRNEKLEEIRSKSPSFLMYWNFPETVQKIIWSPWATVGLGFLIFIGWVIFQFTPLIIIWVSRLHQDAGQGSMDQLKSLATNGHVLSICTIVGGLFGLSLVWIAIKLKKGANFSDYLSLKPISWKTALSVAGISIGCCTAGDFLIFATGKEIVPPIMKDYYVTCGNPAMLLIAIVLLGPIFEEVFFRGFLFEGLRHSRLGNVKAALITSIFWAHLHLQYDYFYIVLLIIFGSYVSYLRLKTGSLWTCIVFHIVMNGWSTIELMLSMKGLLPVH